MNSLLIDRENRQKKQTDTSDYRGWLKNDDKNPI